MKTTAEEHIEEFSNTLSNQRTLMKEPYDPNKVNLYKSKCLEYFEYKHQLETIETTEYITMSTKLKKLNDFYGENIYELIKKPMKIFPRQVYRSNELRHILQYKSGKVSKQVMEQVDLDRLFKLFNIVHCYSNSWDFGDFMTGRF